MLRNGAIPPPGPNLQLIAWATLVTRRVREFLPDVSASHRGQVVTWTRGHRRARLDAIRSDWWMQITSTTGAGTGISTHSERHDHFTAEVAASNIVVHFDGRYCRGLAVSPYSDHDYSMLQNKR